jgi:sugar lactone lactonase YvrE
VGDNVIRLDPEGNATVVIPEIDTPSGLLLMPDGSLLISQYDQSRISRWTEQGGLETWLQGGLVSSPVGMQLDGEGNVYIANFSNGTVIRRSPEGQLDQIADIPGWLGFIALAGDHLYLTAYQQQRIYRTALDGSGTEVWAGSGLQGQVDGPVSEAWFHQPNGIVASPTGDTLYVSDYGTRSLRAHHGSGLPDLDPPGGGSPAR